MQLIKRVTCFFLAAILAVSVQRPAMVASDTYHYGVGGSKLFACNYAYMPMQTNGELLCPLQLLLDGGLGLVSDFKAGERCRLYFKDEPGRYIIFDLKLNNSYNFDWQYDNYSMTRKNGVYYVPLEFVAKRLGFNVSTFPTPYGTVTRVSLVSDLTSDDDVKSILDTQLQNAQENYNRLNSITQTPEPKPSPIVYLGFIATRETDVSTVLDVLDAKGVKATFFLATDMTGVSDVRNIIVRGHTLGIRLESGDDLAALTYANDILRLSALTQTRLVLLSENSEPDRESLESGGYRLWEWKLDGQSTDVFKKIDNARNTCYVYFGCDDASINALSTLLDQLKTLNTEYYTLNEAQPPVFS